LTCANCGAPVPERFCGRCGQERKTLRVAFHRLVGEGIAESFSLDSKIARTLGALVLAPGEATRRYLAGKRASQTSPIKLYLLLSFLYFFASAVGPSRVEVGTGDAQGAPMQVSGDDLGALREMGGVGGRLADRLEALERLPPEEVRRRVNAGISQNAPTAMFFLVPLLALLLRLFFLRSGLFFAEHAVFALHLHALAFLLLIPGTILGSPRATNAGWLAAGLHGVAAMRRVYGRGWAGTVARAFAIGFVYAFCLVVALLVALLAAILAA
jgi:hypothetical protein